MTFWQGWFMRGVENFNDWLDASGTGIVAMLAQGK